ncbi:MAG: hypothetical protein J7463_14875 [Roseiflexus sp.]|jgi:hypothetical protein|nr:hypothetical protein [Roseiflexus sp.]MBO9335051.1 hypothetical protein [Roseiflexus sp.]MBO9365961.1 hypothetical protein [Roseiflexus sp.]MBO9383890.1 hypothetical protein [Roseiflexus sp.]MBO9390718.1 hypothetical protein [Roseiflexus sp.]
MEREGKPYDIEEIAPGRFIVRDPRANSILKGEGDLEGQFFTLRSWRREGLLARLRERGFRVLTLEDRIRHLPPLPPPLPVGSPFWLPLPDNERWSVFDPQRLDWIPVPVEVRNEIAGGVIRQGQVIRRRRGRGIPRYALVTAGATLRTIDETGALIRGYAGATPARLKARRDGERIVLPAHPLPPPHRRLLRRMAMDTVDHCLVIEPKAWALVQEIYARLGVLLSLERQAEAE